MRTLLSRLLLLAAVSVAFARPAPAQELTPAQAAVGSRWRAAWDANRHTEAFDALVELIALSEAQLAPDERAIVEDTLAMHAALGIQNDAVACDCVSDAWMRRFDRLRPPSDPKAETWAHYGFCQLFEATGWFNRGEKAEARQALAEGKAIMRAYRGNGHDAAGFQQSWKGIAKLVEDALSPKLGVGDYVTNRGALQRWIGRIVAMEGRAATVRVTYAHADAPQRVGASITVLDDEYKQLTAVSVDAAVRGWR